MKTSAKIFLAGMFGMAALAPRSAEAAVPGSISHVTPGCVSYQGMLQDVQQGPVTMTVKLYTQLEGGTPIWAAKYNTSVQAGFFSILLGANDGQTVSGSGATYGPTELWKALWPDGATSTPKQVYVGVTVNDGSEVAPRQLLAVAPYAFTAQVAQEALKGASGFAVSGAMSASGNLTHTGTTASLAGGKVSANSTTVNLGTTSTTSKLQGNTVTITSGSGGTSINSSGTTTIGGTYGVKVSNWAEFDSKVTFKGDIQVNRLIRCDSIVQGYGIEGEYLRLNKSGSENRFQVWIGTGVKNAISEVVFSVTIPSGYQGKRVYIANHANTQGDAYHYNYWNYIPLAAAVHYNSENGMVNPNYQVQISRYMPGNTSLQLILDKAATSDVKVNIYMLKIAKSLSTVSSKPISLD